MLLFLLLTSLISAEAGVSKYRNCVVSIGEVTGCSGVGFNGETISRKTGLLYRYCKVSIGEIQSCGNTYTGKTPLDHKGKVSICTVSAGTIQSCYATGYTGEAVLLR